MEATTDNEIKVAVFAMAKALTTNGAVLKGEQMPLNEDGGDDDQDRAITQMQCIVDMLDDFRISCEGQGKAGTPKMTCIEKRELVEDAFVSRVWTQSMTNTRINRISGLKDLTSTPFLVKIVVDIMPILHEMSASPADVKQQMLLLIGHEDMVEKTWALLRKDRSADKSENHNEPICITIASLSKTQSILKLVESSDDYYQREDLVSLLDKIAEQVTLKSTGEGEVPLEVDKPKLKQVLIKVLNEKATRRFSIYNVFVQQWVTRQAATKSAGRFGISLSIDEIVFEVWNFMQRLASLLVERGLSKVQYDPGSVLFAKENELKSFFDLTEQRNHLGEVRRLMLDVSPISKEGFVFSFIHKSILEFLVAKQIRDGILMSIRRINMLSARLDTILKLENWQPGDGHDSMLVGERLNIMERNLKAASLKDLSKSSAQRQVAKSLVAFVEDVLDSSLNKVDLEEEEAVTDFLIDCLLDDVEFCSSFVSVALLCGAKLLHGGALSALAWDNIIVICTATNAKRDGGSILHVVAREDNKYVLDAVCGILDCAPEKVRLQALEVPLQVGQQ